MGDITVVPVWIIQDISVLIAAVLMVFYILDKETHPKTVLLQFLGFVFFYAAVFEITASSLGEGFYAYGRSILMLFNIPITVPIIEFLIIYSTLRVLKSVNIPSWTKPFITGLSAMVFDFSLDPVAVKQIYETLDGTIARWTYYPLAGEPQIYGEPVMNFTGWIYIAGYWTVFILIGEWWHKKKGYSKTVGYIYPFLAALASLACMFSPLSNFFNYMGPFFARTSNMQWVNFIALSVITVGVLALTFTKFWDRKINYSITPKKDFPIMFTFLGFPLVNTIFCLIGGFTEVLWLVVLAQIVLMVAWIGIYRMGKKASPIAR